MPTQYEGDAPELFMAGVLPAKKSVVHVAARIALQALVEDLANPGVQRTANYHLIRYIACVESFHEGYTIEHLEAIRQKYHVDGLTDDSVDGLIREYIDVRRRYA